MRIDPIIGAVKSFVKCKDRNNYSDLWNNMPAMERRPVASSPSTRHHGYVGVAHPFFRLQAGATLVRGVRAEDSLTIDARSGSIVVC
jgi:hypothetical protein